VNRLNGRRDATNQQQLALAIKRFTFDFL